MSKHFSFFLTAMVLGLFTLYGDERVGGTLENVDLLIEDLYNDDGYNFGEKYVAINRGQSQMRISIRLTDMENVEDHLIDHTVILGPHRKVDLGYVIQNNLAKSSNWKYEWKAQKDAR